MGTKGRIMRLDEKRIENGVVIVRSRCVAMELDTHDGVDTYTSTAPLKFTKLFTWRAATLRRRGSIEWTRVLSFYDIVMALP